MKNKMLFWKECSLFMNEYVKNLNRIEFVVTMACTGKCKHCSEGDHINCKGHIDTELAVKSVRQICEKYKIESLMTFGGEPLIYPDIVCAIHKTATDMGIEKKQLITNGFFSKKRERIEEVVTMLEKSGVNSLLLSVDAFHQETIPLEPVKYFAECVVKSKIPVKLGPAWLVSEEDNNPYNLKTKEVLGKFKDLHIPIGSGNIVFPSGNALKYLSEYFEDGVAYSSPYEEDIFDVRAISFSPNGDVLNGNINNNDIQDILESYRP